MAKRRMIIDGVQPRKVTIWITGATGSGKTLLAQFIMKALEAKGIESEGGCDTADLIEVGPAGCDCLVLDSDTVVDVMLELEKHRE